jgi:hypothetical protein
VGISKVNSDGCYYVVRNQVNPPGSETCTNMCNSFLTNIAQALDGGNGIPAGLDAFFFQCYQCYGWFGGGAMTFPCPNSGNPTDPNGITVSLDGVNIDPAILATASTMVSDCDSIFSSSL